VLIEVDKVWKIIEEGESVIIYLICNKGKPISMIKSGEEPEEFLKRNNRGKNPEEFLKWYGQTKNISIKIGNEKTVIALTQEDVRDIIGLNKRG